MEDSFNIAHEAAGTVFRARAEEKMQLKIAAISYIICVSVLSCVTQRVELNPLILQQTEIVWHN